MPRKKIKAKRKNFWDATEINALQKCYGKPLGYKDYRSYVIIPALLMAAFAFALTHFWWISLICGIYGAIYGRKVIMPKSIERFYNMRSMNERNRFINNLTQILTDGNKTTLRAIEMAQSRAKGELQVDLNILVASLEGSDKNQVSEAFQEINKKYERDVIFCQFMEQVETAIYEGRNDDIETLKQLKTYHNEVMADTELFLQVKNEHYKGLKLIVGLISGMILMVTFSFGFETFHEAFARSWIGWIFGGIFYFILILLMKSFYKIFFDDAVMSVGKYKSKEEKDKESDSLKEKEFPQFFKKTRKFWFFTLGDEDYKLLIEMNNSDETIIKWQAKRLLKCALVAIYGIMLAIFLGNLSILGIGVALTFAFYHIQRSGIKQMYHQYQFERQLEFAKFTRLVIPHLKLKRNGGNLYGIFNKLLPRMEHEEDRILLMNLMQDMSDRPNEIEPFLSYAEKASGTDKAVLFMGTVFDIKQGSSDLNVIEEIDKMMSHELMNTIKQIIQYKEKRFAMFSTKVTMSSIIFTLGVGASFLVYEFQQSGIMSVIQE